MPGWSPLLLAVLACGKVGTDQPPKDIPPLEDTGVLSPVVTLGDPLYDDAYGNRMCVAGEAVYVAWTAEVDGEPAYVVLLQASGDGGATWLEAPVPVGPPGYLLGVELACDPGGVTVVWQQAETEDGPPRVHANRSEDGGTTWLPAPVPVVDPGASALALGPAVVAHDSTRWAAWYDNTDGAYDVRVARSDDRGATWAPPVRVDSDAPGAAYSARPLLATSDDGSQVWVVFEDARDGRHDIRFARSGDGGTTFDPDVRLDTDAPGATDAMEPRLCSDGYGELYVVWHDARNGERDIFLNHSSDGGRTWLAEDVRVDSDTPGASNSLYPRCLWAEGTAHVVWQDVRAGSYSVYHRRVEDGVPGPPEERLDAGVSPGQSNALDPQLATDRRHVIVAWRDGRNDDAGQGHDDLFFNVAPVRGAFDTTDHRLDSTAEDGASFKVSLQIALVDGEVLASWADGQSGTSEIVFRRLPVP